MYFSISILKQQQIKDSRIKIVALLRTAIFNQETTVRSFETCSSSTLLNAHHATFKLRMHGGGRPDLSCRSKLIQRLKPQGPQQTTTEVIFHINELKHKYSSQYLMLIGMFHYSHIFHYILKLLMVTKFVNRHARI